MKFKLILQASAIMNKMGIKDELIALVSKYQKTFDAEKKDGKTEPESQSKLGMEIMFVLFEKITLAEKETYTLLTDLTGIEDIPEADLSEVVGAAIAAFKEVDAKSFFTQLFNTEK